MKSPSETHTVRIFLLLFSITITIHKIVDGVQRVCARMEAKLHTATFVTFDFDPSLILRLITDMDFDQNEFLGIKWWTTGLQNV